ncbi:MAG: PAS domain S-box protein, partial [Deltaproteobacteria bacterium]|nr:PAS domain S-box protein [Deltaproteobacteria bacterium]
PGGTVQGEYRHRRKDGGWVYLEAIGTNYLHEPSIKGIVLNIRDITDRKQAEEALRKSEERFRTIIESMEDGYYEVDLAGRFTFFNEAIRRMTGFPADELIGMSDLEYTEPETAKRLYKTFNEVYRTITDGKGQPTGFRGIVRDATKRKEVEEELRESEIRYRLLAENLADVVWTTDMKLRLDYISPSVFALTGYTPEEFMDISLDRYMPPASLELCYKAFKEELALAASGKGAPDRTRTLEVEHVRKDGSVIWVEMKMSATLDQSGRWIGILGVTRDITERKQAEKTQRESEKKYRELFEKSEDAILIIHNGKFVDCNQAAIKMLRYNRKDELLNMHPSELSPEKQPDGKLSFAKADELMKTAFKNGSHRFEWYHKKSDGEIFPVEVLLTVISDDEKNQILHTVWRDITERKQAEEALRKSEERFRTIIESMEDGYYEVDLAGKFTFFNEAMRGVLGFSADELMGMSDLEYTSPETAKKIYKTFNKTYRTGIPANLEDYEVIRRDGSIRTIEFKAALMRDEKGQPAGFRGVVRDVTKRKEMENELERRFQYLEGVLEAAPYAIIALDHHHQVVKWNPGAEKLFGYSQEEVIGKELDSLVATTPDAMEEARRATKTTMGGEALLSWETVRFRKNGSPVDVIAAGSPIMVDGGLIGVVAMYDDITDRKKAEKAFRDSEKKYRALSETATDMTYT